MTRSRAQKALRRNQDIILAIEATADPDCVEATQGAELEKIDSRMMLIKILERATMEGLEKPKIFRVRVEAQFPKPKP